MTQTNRPLRIAFMGTPEFSVPTLQALIDAGHDVVRVYSQPPAKAGRGKKLRKSPVHQLAEAKGIEICTPKSLKSLEVQEDFYNLNLDVAVVVAYGQILPSAILEAPEFGCVNVHASLLPRWRGAAPIHRAIIAGDQTSGVCIMKMDAGLDTGPVILRAETPITHDENTGSLHDKLAQMGAETINKALEGYVTGQLIAEEQSNEGITYAKKIDKSEAAIDWSYPAEKIDRLVRGLNPFPGAYSMIGGERLKILAGTIQPSAANHKPGQTLSDSLLIQCGHNTAYQINLAQRSGKGAMTKADLLRGWSVPKGSQFTS